MAVTSHGVRNLLHADGATFVLREGDRCYYAEEDAISPLWKGRRFPLSTCLSGWVMTNRRPAAVADIEHDPRIPADLYRPTFVRSLAMAPVGADDPKAALGAYWSAARQPDPRQVELLAAIADAAELAVAHVQLEQRQQGRRNARAKPPSAGAAARKASASASWRSALARLRQGRPRAKSLEPYVFAVLCVAAATLARGVLGVSGADRLPSFSTYYPAVLVAMLAGGRRAGIVAVILSALAGNFFFMPPIGEFAPLNATDALNLTIFCGVSALIIFIMDFYKRAVGRLRQEDALHLTLAREQRHRLKNAVSVVEVVVRQSLREDPERAKTINHRIRAALAEIDMQERDDASPVGLRDLLTEELQPYDLARFRLDGDLEEPVPPALSGLLALAVHELTTNALKHGALSAPQGCVAVMCRRLSGRLTMDWRETGGPPIRPPSRRGYGSIMLRRLIEAAGGDIAMDFPRTGLTARIGLPLEPARGVVTPARAS